MNWKSCSVSQAIIITHRSKKYYPVSCGHRSALHLPTLVHDHSHLHLIITSINAHSLPQLMVWSRLHIVDYSPSLQRSPCLQQSVCLQRLVLPQCLLSHLCSSSSSPTVSYHHPLPLLLSIKHPVNHPSSSPESALHNRNNRRGREVCAHHLCVIYWSETHLYSYKVHQTLLQCTEVLPVVWPSDCGFLKIS